MQATRRRTQTTTVAAGLSLALAAGAALAFTVAGVLPVRAESLETLAVLAGAALLVWAVIVEGVLVAHLLATALRRRRAARLDMVLVVVTATLLATVFVVYPLVGSSGGHG